MTCQQGPERYDVQRTGSRKKLTRSSEVAGGKVLGCLEWKVVDEPSVTQWTVGNVGNLQLLGSFDQTICLVDRLKGGILRLDGIDLGNYEGQQ